MFLSLLPSPSPSISNLPVKFSSFCSLFDHSLPRTFCGLKNLLCNFLVDKNYIYVKSAEIKVANLFWSTSNQRTGSGATDYSSFRMAQIQHYFSLFIFSTCLFNNAQLVNAKIQEQIPSNRRLKILVFSPSLSYSHARFLGRIADTFVEAGHETHFFKFDTDQFLLGKNETRLVKKIYRLKPTNVDMLDITKVGVIKDGFAGTWPLFNFLHHPMEIFNPLDRAACQELIQQKEILDELASQKYDVGIAELYDPCVAAFMHRIGVRTTLGASAVPLFQMVARRFGIPGFASFMPNLFGSNMQISKPGSLETPFWTRLLNFYNEFYEWAYMDNFIDQSTEEIIKRAFGHDFPSSKELARNTSLFFVNSNPFFEFPRPISNKIIYIGGLEEENNKQVKLDTRSQQILDNARDGAILLSFGSIADTKDMPAQMRAAIIKAFAHFPSTEFIWKLDSNSHQNDMALFAAAPNVHIFEWVHQTGMLQHPNLRAFITHCGQNSLTEAARAGVPVIGIPLFGDQQYNSRVAKFAGIGVEVDVRELNGPNAEEIMIEAVGKILKDPNYRNNAKLLSKKLALTPFSASENLVRWVEFAAEFPNLNELNLPGDDQLHWFYYYSLDAITFTIAMICSLILLIWKFAKFMIKTAPGLVRHLAFWLLIENDEKRRQKIKQN